jgi:uncharacterized membrane protein (UPF0127 family)
MKTHNRKHDSALPKTIAFVVLAFFSLHACAQISAPDIAINDDFGDDFADLTEEEKALLQDDSKISIEFKNQALKVEFADSPDERALGLMHRKTLCEDCGMLFQFDSERIASIWMKNTFIPLDLAYITVDGTIVDIKQLEPHDLTSIQSSKKVLYALEMNQGWFAKNDIAEGDKISIEGRVKQPKSFKTN